VIIRLGRFAGVDPFTLYAILQLRAEIFVVEQNCAYLDLDGLDTNPDTWHVWAEDNGEVVAYLRILAEPDGAARIGRVCVTKAWRGQGVADKILVRALQEINDRPVRLNAQTGVAKLYASHGFVVDGDEFLEDGIPHLPMSKW
jgi:ElaA protein